eukprot:56507-Amphidinium_carterae.1
MVIVLNVVRVLLFNQCLYELLKYPGLYAEWKTWENSGSIASHEVSRPPRLALHVLRQFDGAH